jgi:hypothetical protein
MGDAKTFLTKVMVVLVALAVGKAIKDRVVT